MHTEVAVDDDACSAPEVAPATTASIAVPVILGTAVPAAAGTAASPPGAVPTTGRHAKPGKKMKLSTRARTLFKSDFAANNPHIHTKGRLSLAEELKIHLEHSILVSAVEVQLWETRASNVEGAQAQSQDPYSSKTSTT
ncbi:hypothetical protein FISHEDRAFT_77607 [Fistulina hepatica ATCC 64428]|uniref:Uncharacterized protein n=1 Tax=Fistulina hepatica ATCC 64428 TaxID=1128425 RepID=A0A0D7A111_9AGAR|nr:hypothetical protein FISHEDRAFT_77607 [Fistulina hepatica ATCC 64428]